MAKKRVNINLPSVDELFTSQVERDSKGSSVIQSLPIASIAPFPNHPFGVRDDQDMEQLVESIQEHGILSPLTVRATSDGAFELISGHRRKHAAEKVGLADVPCIVKGKGGEGDVVEVANGFANNYLFPKNLAVAATKGNLKQLEQRKHNIATREENRIAEANKTKEILDALTVKVEARVGEEGVLFGSVTAQMIADAVKAQADIDIDRRRVEIKTAIKSAGTHEVAIQLYRDIKANLTILVGDADTFAAAEATEAPAEAEAETAEEATEEAAE